MAANSTSFKPGNPGGPGRTPGTRNKLSEAFIKALSDDFTEHGIKTVAQVRTDKPDAYLNVIGKLMPKLMELSGEVNVPVSGTVRFIEGSDAATND